MIANPSSPWQGFCFPGRKFDFDKPFPEILLPHRTWNDSLLAANTDSLGFCFPAEIFVKLSRCVFVAPGLAICCLFWHLVNHRSAILISKLHPAFCWIDQVCSESCSFNCRRLGEEGHVNWNYYHYLITTFAFVSCTSLTNYVLFTNSIYLFGFHYLSYFRSALSLRWSKKKKPSILLFVFTLTCDIKVI